MWRRRPWLLLLLLLPPLVAAAERGDPPTPAVIARLAARSLLLGLATLPDGRLVAVGERGHVLLSTDAATSWKQSPTPASATLTAVYFANAAHGWAVGHDEAILETRDGGTSWQLRHWAPERQQPLLGVWFDAAGHGLAVGAFATVYSSADGGQSWQSAPFEPVALPAQARRAEAQHPKSAADAMRDDEGITQPHLNAIVADATGRLYVAAEAGHLYRSDDAGAHWFTLSPPYTGSFFGVLPLGGDALLAYGLRGHLYRSEDAGRSWQQLASGTQMLLAGATRLADGTIVIVGTAGVVLVSRDGGHAFTVHQEADRKGFSAVTQVPGGVVVVGDGGFRRLNLVSLAPQS